MFEFMCILIITEREFDADKHCGVWVEEQKKRCTRSLTCKVILALLLHFDPTVLLCTYWNEVFTENTHNSTKTWLDLSAMLFVLVMLHTKYLILITCYWSYSLDSCVIFKTSSTWSTEEIWWTFSRAQSKSELWERTTAAKSCSTQAIGVKERREKQCDEGKWFDNRANIKVIKWQVCALKNNWFHNMTIFIATCWSRDQRLMSP